MRPRGASAGARIPWFLISVGTSMTPKNEFSAEASLLGYLYQVRLALLLTLERDDEQVFIESLDDVALAKTNGQFELVQAKLHLKRAGSLTDRSPDLWKTLRVWSTLVKNGAVDLDQTTFRLVTSSVAPAGSAGEALRSAVSETRDEARALVLLRAAAAETTNAANFPAYQAFNGLSPEQQAGLFAKVEVLDAAESITDIKDRILKLIELAARAGHIEAFFQRIEGWWFNRVILALTDGSCQPILKRDLRAQVDDLRDSFRQDALPIDFLDLEAPLEKDLRPDERAFIEQLRLVAISNPRIRSAIEDYYRAYAQRSRWLRDGLVLPGDLESYERRLVDEWKRRHDTMVEDLGQDATEDQKRRDGKALYGWCEQQAHIPIRPNCTEKFVMRGSYHLLANDLKVGWHADFLARLARVLKPASTDVELEPENA